MSINNGTKKLMKELMGKYVVDITDEALADMDGIYSWKKFHLHQPQINDKIQKINIEHKRHMWCIARKSDHGTYVI